MTLRLPMARNNVQSIIQLDLNCRAIKIADPHAFAFAVFFNAAAVAHSRTTSYRTPSYDCRFNV